jgi:hypothetical protein
LLEKLKTGENITPAGSPLGHQEEGHRGVFFLTTAHEDVLVQVPSSRGWGAHHKIKPAVVSDYKYGVDRSKPDAVTLFI